MMVDSDAAFARWYEGAYPGLVRSLVLIAGDADAAVEAADEAVARCWIRWRSRRAPQDPTAWTYTVAVNLLRRRWRRARWLREHPPEREATSETPVPAVELWAAVSALPLRMRTAVALRYLGDLSEREVATVMGIKPGTVGATLHAARASLARQLGDELQERSNA